MASPVTGKVTRHPAVARPSSHQTLNQVQLQSASSPALRCDAPLHIIPRRNRAQLQIARVAVKLEI